jgi:hypothetical protein
MYDSVVGIAERAQGSGLLARDVAPFHFHYILVGATTFIFHQAEECKRLTGVDPTDASIVEDHARLVERMLLGPRNEETES